jgi:hypothetical protein
MTRGGRPGFPASRCRATERHPGGGLTFLFLIGRGQRFTRLTAKEREFDVRYPAD